MFGSRVFTRMSDVDLQCAKVFVSVYRTQAKGVLFIGSWALHFMPHGLYNVIVVELVWHALYGGLKAGISALPLQSPGGGIS